MFAKRQFYHLMNEYVNTSPYSHKLKVLVRLYCEANQLQTPSVKNISKWLVELYEDPNFNAWGKSEDSRNYTSGEFKRLRKVLVNRYGEKCMACGSEEHIAVDHIKPYSFYPELSTNIDNLQLLCRSCNSRKSNRRIIDYRPIDTYSLTI